MLGLALLGVTLGVFVIALRFPKTRAVMIPLMFVLASVGIACNTLSIIMNLQDLY